MHFVEIRGIYTLCGNREEFINYVEIGEICIIDLGRMDVPASLIMLE